MAAETQALLAFIEAAKSQGASDEFVVALLRQNGWSEKRIYQAFSGWYEAQTGRAVPNGGGRIEAAKDAFLYLLSFIALGIWAVQLGALLFNAIDRTFPNPAVVYTNAAWIARTMADELASVIVAFPLFLLVTRGIARATAQQPERLESSVRKWLTYIALVITASIMIGDVVTFLAYFLRGDLNSRFVLKVFVALVIAGGVFTYYLDSLNRDRVSSTRNRSFALAALAMVSLGIVVGFVQIGSPAVQRSASEDTRRLFDLSSFAQGVHVMWETRGQLPAKMQALPEAGLGASTSDPVSGRTYEYIPLQGPSYHLCARFSAASPVDVPIEWHHSSGHVCFALDARNNVEIVQRQW